ncbi:MAG: MATE family efflux transporter [Coxiellaceae bacterium]|nr:MATE family efflux transporter [Coxiellaceae bacterium]
MQLNKRILHLAVPMIVSNLTVPLLGLVDTAVMGHLSFAYYLAAVGIGAMIFDLLYWSFGFLRMGTTGLASQAFGQADTVQMALVLARHVIVACVIGLLLVILQVPIAKVAFHLIDASAKITHYGLQYFHYRIWAAPAVLVNFVFMGWFIGIQKPRIPLLLSLVINVVAAILDIVFVYGFGMTVDGVALATVIAQYMGCALGCYCVYDYLHGKSWRWQSGVLFAKQHVVELFGVNRDIFIRTLSLLLVFAYFTREGAQFGAIILAANVILFNFQDAMAFALDGFANAAEALVGEAVGKKDAIMLQQAIRQTGWFSCWVALVFAAVYLFLGGPIIHLLTSISHVQLAAHQYLIYMIISPIISVWSFWLDGIYVGAMRTQVMRNCMVISTLIFFVVFWLLYSLQNHGLWLAFLSFMAARAITMGLWLRYKKIQIVLK